MLVSDRYTAQPVLYDWSSSSMGAHPAPLRHCLNGLLFVFIFAINNHSGKDIDILVSKHISKILGVFSPVIILF